MHFFKWLGVLLLFACGALVGAAAAALERRRVTQAEAFLRLLGVIRVQIECFSLPLPRIFAACDEALWRDLGIAPQPQNFQALLEGVQLYLAPDICLLLTEFGTRLGSGYREEELRALDYYMARLAPYCDRLRAELPKRQRLSWLLPLALSAALVLLLL